MVLKTDDEKHSYVAFNALSDLLDQQASSSATLPAGHIEEPPSIAVCSHLGCPSFLLPPPRSPPWGPFTPYTTTAHWKYNADTYVI